MVKNMINILSTSHVDLSTPCKLHNYKSYNGYGFTQRMVGKKMKSVGVHRYNLCVFLKIDYDDKRIKKLQCSHECHNPKCINPLHLTFRTHTKNIEMKLENNHCLCKKDILNIIEDRKTMSIKSICNKYNISRYYVYSILSGKCWSSITKINFKYKNTVMKPLVTIDTNECIDHNTKGNSKGYSKKIIVINNKKRSLKQHKYSYIYNISTTNGVFNKNKFIENLNRIDDNNLVIRHLCNNSRCINPNHLKEGTHKENAQDRELKYKIQGRPKKSISISNSKSKLGNGRKMTNEEALIIFKDRKEKGDSYEKMSKRYNLSKTCIIDICLKRSYKEIHDE